MQAVSILPSSPTFSGSHASDELAEISGKFAEDFGAKLKVEGGTCKNEMGDEFAQGSEKFAEDLKAKLEIEDENLRNEVAEAKEGENEKKEEEEEDEDEEFSFACAIPDGSPVSADEVFDNGQIRPMFPIFNRDLLFANGYDGGDSPLQSPLRKLFVEQREISSSTSSSASESDELDGAPEGPYCEWSGKTAMEANEKCKKSNSTGFSKLWRFRELKLRSNSDGKDAFIFLKPSATTTSSTKRSGSGEKTEKAAKLKMKAEQPAKNVVIREAKGKTASSAHEKHYVMNRARKESGKRKSYLPYRKDLVGFFTNVNGLSRNVHPF